MPRTYDEIKTMFEKYNPVFVEDEEHEQYLNEIGKQRGIKVTTLNLMNFYSNISCQFENDKLAFIGLDYVFMLANELDIEYKDGLLTLFIYVGEENNKLLIAHCLLQRDDAE